MGRVKENKMPTMLELAKALKIQCEITDCDDCPLFNEYDECIPTMLNTQGYISIPREWQIKK